MNLIFESEKDTKWIDFPYLSPIGVLNEPTGNDTPALTLLDFYANNVTGSRREAQRPYLGVRNNAPILTIFNRLPWAQRSDKMWEDHVNILGNKLAAFKLEPIYK
ncbi:hypothetical protein FF38_13591 [Lucilia cuprina]|uniref:Uncharacterized protein n=1 Tax=Lucilia cuprina TaxID=7375 RepID=A0A0L0BR52_LUCCU|nr:hypothetical protein FF38_13591 [Lucilia cuprina]